MSRWRPVPAPHGATSGVSPSSSSTLAGCAARTDRRVTCPSWLLLSELVCPEGRRPCAGVSPLTSRVLPDRCRVLPGKITAQGAVQWPGSSIGNSHRGTALTLSRGHPMASRPGPRGHQDRGPEAVRQSYALRECSRALLVVSKPALASCSQVAAGGDCWLLMAIRGISGACAQ